ncbi:hypothetical protein GGF40_003461, partial [Coemansia sp. RSA 1286]
MDRKSERNREFLYTNLSKQLGRLHQNIEQLNRNVAVMTEQAELSQRLAISHTAMFIGAKDVFESVDR